jgi:hypothetical protein
MHARIEKGRSMTTFLFSPQRQAVVSLLAAVSLSLPAVRSQADTPDPSVTLGPRASDLKVGPRMNAAGRDLRGCKFVGKDLTGAVFDRACLRGVQFWDCGLARASFKGADLSNAGFD